METPVQPSSGKTPIAKVIVIVVVAVIVAAALWYAKFYQKPKQAAAPAQGFGPAVNAPTSTLGAQLYQKANNPIQDKLPATVAPVPNPIQNVYKNPFE